MLNCSVQKGMHKLVFVVVEHLELVVIHWLKLVGKLSQYSILCPQTHTCNLSQYTVLKF